MAVYQAARSFRYFTGIRANEDRMMNEFKNRVSFILQNSKLTLKLGIQQIGIWNTIGGNTVPEALANCGFDWVLVY